MAKYGISAPDGWPRDDVIKTVLNHIIYEICIKIVFDAITVNFSDVKREKFTSIFGLLTYRRKYRRQLPELLATKTVSVQPITGPSKTYEAIREVYGKGRDPNCDINSR